MGMFGGLFSSDRLLKPVRKIADKVEAFASEYQAMSDDILKQKTAEFKERFQNGETLDELLPEVFAQVREASSRVIGLRHFYVQLLGAIVLHQGNISEMRTGEGKTLVATLPAVLNAIPGLGVHIVTVNEYLAKRDSEWMGKIYRFLGYSVGLVTREMTKEQKQAAYNSDILYATNNELGFDYLRDNMVIRRADLVQRELNYAIVDEVDSILIDEARTPLIISGAGDKGTDLYEKADRFVSRLKKEEDFDLDEKLKAVNLTESGVKKAESYFEVENLSDIENTEISHHINQALKAHNIMFRDRDYVVVDGEVIIVDEFTGRLMIGRRYSDGLHQAIEAKEHVNVERESKTLATITFQNYFRMYKKLSGMTGTAKTEEEEFKGIYNLEVLEIPTHMDMVRKDLNDAIYSTKKGKFDAVAQEIEKIHAVGQPVLVGTVSVADSEYVSGLLIKKGIKHEVLNAKNHLKEAQIIAQAGKKGAVTIATNMAGRGTDILLGGNPDYLARNEMRALEFDDELIEQANSHVHTEDPDILRARKTYAELLAKHKTVTEAEHKEVVRLGGLFILGTERHESRRIDNQLRGRSGRQGDPGSSKFFVALEDDLMRLFGGERVKNIMDTLVGDENVPLEMGMLTRQIENAQKRIEGNNYNIRKHVLEYDDVMNKQREVIYTQRRQVLMGGDITDYTNKMVTGVVDQSIDAYCPDNKFPEEWDIKALNTRTERLFGTRLKDFTQEELSGMDKETLRNELSEKVAEVYHTKEEEMEKAGYSMREIERMVLLRVVDEKWMDHIDAMDQFRRGISLRALGQRNPVVEYRMEGFDMFDEMVSNIREDTVYMLFHIKVQSKVEQIEQREIRTNSPEDGPAQPVKKEKTTGRNALCPCGSGKKYKNCCGKS